jgi:hypothetical protein
LKFQGDIIFLRDLSLLYNENFAYKWSYSPQFNTAIIGFNKYVNPQGGKLVEHVLARTNSALRLTLLFHPFKLAEHIAALNRTSTVFDNDLLRMYHSYLFDSAWLCYDRWAARETPTSVCFFEELITRHFIDERDFARPSQIFPGAFTYHQRLRNSVISNLSYFKYFENFYEKKLTLNL